MSYSIVGEQIAKLRKERGLTQRELGERAGVSSSAVSQWESGGTPDISLLPVLSDVLGVTVDALFGRTGTERENLAEVVGGYIASLPEDKKLEGMASIMGRAMTVGCTKEVASTMNVERCDSEATYIFQNGLAASAFIGGRSFLSVIHNGAGGFDELLPCDEGICRLFAALSDPHALALLAQLYRESLKYRTARALARLAGIDQAEAESILSGFSELELTEELSLETEEGNVKAYKVSLYGATVSLLFSAWLMTKEEHTLKLVADRRGLSPSDESK